MIDKVIAEIEAQKDRHLELYCDLLRIPSISTDPERKDDIRRGAEWVLKLLTDMQVDATVVETEGHPCVIGDTGPADGGGPTVLAYGHYDVQPVGDESLWDSPAFEPTIRDGVMYARGSADDKGQALTHLLAAAAWMKIAGKPPVRVKFCIEGEEEIGSPHLGDLISKHKDALACDYVVISDTAKFSADQPAITYGTKGLVYKEIKLSGPKQDLHSGSFGGTIANPGNVLANIIASLKDADLRITIPGFYDDVREISQEEKAAMAGLAFDEKAYLASLGAPGLEGEKGYTTLERRWARPTLDVNGLFGGFMGPGASTIIPKHMSAKISMRIVPDQDPEKISKLFDEAIHAATPPGVRVEIVTHGLAAAYLSELGSPGMNAATAAVAAGFGKDPVYIREGGSLPILPLFKQTLGADSLMMGFCVPDCNAHGPNEFFALSDFHNGTKAAAHFLDRLSQV